LDLYIHRGLAYSLTNAFTDIFLELNLTDEDTYDLYKVQDFQYDNRLFGLLKSANFWRSRQLNVFNDTFVGISTLYFSISEVNYIRFGVFVSSILLFIFAKKLARNSFFFYGSGCSLGFLTSLLIIVFIMYRIAPKSLVRLPFIIGGWSLSFYALHFIWRNSGTIFVKYQKLLLAYFVTVLAISFAVCYKRGPPKDSRSHDIAQWTLQAIALILIYSSSQVGHLLTSKAYLQFCFSDGRTFLRRKIFPPKPRLLTEEEYEKEGQEVTRRELERLREFCRSPEADLFNFRNKEGHILEDEEDLYDEESGYSNQ
uniref:Nuclear envelope integral membrane protein 1 n=1 Tax=Angiostrongylus cantonensis TaxID=6313 RepID=A0A0K0CWD0_ANGCA